jgi:hypothetical protein
MDSSSFTADLFLRQMLSQPLGIVAAVLATIFLLWLMSSERWMWWVLGVLIAASTLGPFKGADGTWYPPPPPLDQLVIYGRAMTGFILGIVLLALIYRLMKDQRYHAPTVSIAITLLYGVLCFRHVLGGAWVEGFARLAVYGLVFITFGFIIPSMLWSIERVRSALWSVVVAAIFFASLQFYIMLLDYNQGTVQGRWFGTTITPNSAAMVVALLLPAPLGSALLKSYKRSLRIALWATSGFLIIVLLLTNSRGGALTAIVSILFLFRIQLGRFLFFIVPLVLGIYLVLSYAGYQADEFERLLSTENTRQGVYAFMFKEWLSAPVFGSIESGWRVSENGYLGVLVRSGLFGGFLMLIVLLLGLQLVVRAIRVRAKLGPDAFLVDIAIAGLTAFAANNLFEATFFSNLSQSIFLMYLYIAILDAAVRLSTTPQGMPVALSSQRLQPSLRFT